MRSASGGGEGAEGEGRRDGSGMDGGAAQS